MSERRTITLQVTLGSRPAESETTCAWAGPYAFVVATTLPGPGLALEVHSSFVGHSGVPTYVTHLTLGPIGHAPRIVTSEHERASLDPVLKARQCLYEHAGIVLETLTDLGYEVGIDTPGDPLDEFVHVEHE